MTSFEETYKINAVEPHRKSENFEIISSGKNKKWIHVRSVQGFRLL
jgi:hypothetical protein